MAHSKIQLASGDITSQFQSLRIIQGVGEHHNFTLRIHNEDRAAHFKGSLADASKKWIGKPLKVQGFFEGIITSVGLARARSGGSDFIVGGYSPTILLDDGLHTRSFGEKSLKQILDEAMKTAAGKLGETDVNPQYTKKIKYCVQYRESNFSFINRLAYRFGEWFYYDGTKLVFGKAPSGKALRLNFERDLSFFDIALKTRPVNFEMALYDYKNHSTPLKKSSSYTPPQNEFAKIAFDKSKGELFPEKSLSSINLGMDDSDFEQVVKLRQNAHLSELVVLTGASTQRELRVGSIIEIVDPRSGLLASGTDNYGKYIITEITHEFLAEGDGYSNHFEAIPADAVIPPMTVSPDPPACEMQIAEVVENNDPKGLGRVRVQFVWQKDAQGEDKMTNWIRVASPHTGDKKGVYMLPEKGDSVLVAFEHNHPERAYVLTGMYHSEAKPEHHDPQNLKKFIKTKGGHEILMNDEKGKESMALTSPTDFSATAKQGTMTLTANGAVSIKSEKDNITIESPATITIHAKEIIIKADKSIEMKAPKIEIKADTELSASSAKVDIEGKASSSLKGNGKLDIASQGMTSITGSMVKLN